MWLCNRKNISLCRRNHQTTGSKATILHQDTQDFIAKMKLIGRIPSNSYLVTLDVSSLYTNIDNQEGLQAMKEFLQRSESPKENAAVSLMEQVLSKNNFVFNGQNYIQVKGTAMGTRAAPNYANLFMGSFEERHIYKSIWKKHIRYFGKYIDDLFMIWTGSEA